MAKTVKRETKRERKKARAFSGADLSPPADGTPSAQDRLPGDAGSSSNRAPVAATARAPRGPSRFETTLGARWVLPAVLVLAALLRVWHITALAGTPFFDHLSLDCLVYDEWAQRIAAGDWMGSRIFYQDPLYPYFLGVVYAVFGRSFWIVYLLQVTIGVGTCWLTALLGRRVFGVTAGNLAALATALFVPSIFYEVQIEKTFLSVFLVAAFLVLVLDRRHGARVGAGAALALASLTRANLIVFIPLGVLVLLFERKTDSPRKAGHDFLRAPDAFGFGQAASLFAGCFLVLAPVVLRNHHVEGQWVLTTSQAGQNFYIGNNPMNTTGGYIVPDSIRPDPRYEETDFRAEAEKRTNRKLTPPEVSDFWSDEAWTHILGAPAFAEMMFERKFLLFWNDYEVPDNLNMYLIQRWSWVLRLPLLGVGLLTAFAMLGAAVALRDNSHARVLAGFVAVYCATVVAFFVFSRYRIQILPVLAVFAAHGVLWLADQAKRARWESVAAGMVAVLVTGLFCFQSFDWLDRTKGIAISLNNLGALYTEMGDTPKAIAAYEEAVQVNPRRVVAAIRLLGDHYLKKGDFVRAEQYMRQVITIKPESQLGWGALASLYTKRAETGDADAFLADKLADALLRAGRTAEARRVVDDARAAGRPPAGELEQRLLKAENGGH